MIQVPPLSAQDVHAVMGMTMVEISRTLHPSIPESRRGAVFARCNTFEVEYLREHGGMPYPSLRPVMESLKARGFRLGIVSNCQCGYVDAFLRSSDTRDLFSDYEEWERTGLSKGENIRLVMERNGFRKAVYVGDTRKDEEAARRAGVPFLHASYGFGSAQAPDGVITSLRDLPDAVDRLVSRMP